MRGSVCLKVSVTSDCNMVKILEMLMNSPSAKQSKATPNHPRETWSEAMTSSEAVAGSGRSAAKA